MADQELRRLHGLAYANGTDARIVLAGIKGMEDESAKYSLELCIDENTYVKGWQIITNTLLARIQFGEQISEDPPISFEKIQEADMAGWKGIYLPKVFARIASDDEKRILTRVGELDPEESAFLYSTQLINSTYEAGWYLQHIEPIKVNRNSTVKSIEAKLRSGDMYTSTLSTDIYSRAVDRLLGMKRNRKDRETRVLCAETSGIRENTVFGLLTAMDESQGNKIKIEMAKDLSLYGPLSLRYLIPMTQYFKGIPDVMEDNNFSA